MFAVWFYCLMESLAPEDSVQCGAGSFGSVLVLVASSSDGVVVRGRVLGGVRGVRLGAVVVVVW